MAGDYSRETFDPEKHYSAVRMQQGRVQLDADWNELVAIQQHRTGTETTDVVGPAGVPKLGNGFKIRFLAGGDPLTIAPGRLYVGGLLCELSRGATYFQQPFYPAPDASFLLAPPGSPPASPPDSPPTSPPGGGPPVLRDGTYVVYLDAWQREINFRDDAHLHEVALGEADTTTRLQTVWQVRLLPVATGGLPPAACATAFPEWDALVAPATGQLNVRTQRTPDPKDPCLLPPTTGFRRLENQLYRVEVQQGGALDAATFKWSRDNASVETKIEAIDGATLTVADLGRDAVLGFAGGQWVEVVDENAALTSRPHPLFEIIAVDADAREITLDGSANAFKANANLKLRRWDQPGPAVAMAAGAPGGWLDLEDGIQVAFAAGTYRAGDYWTFAARTATGEVEWPPFAVPNLAPAPQPPAGPAHHYCRLAVAVAQGGAVALQDCRPLFPALTDLAAADVRFDNANCQLPGASTVQDALDQLCRTQGGSCTLTARPGPGWEAVFDRIKDGQDAQVCFPVGDFVLRAPATIARKGHLKLSGSGPGTRILGPGLAAGLVFDGCQSVLVRDLYAETSRPPKPAPAAGPRPTGALTFINCPAVDVEQVGLKCGTGPLRTVTCLTVRNAPEGPGAVRVRGCDLLVGHRQRGIVLVNVTTALVEGNTLRADPASGPATLQALLADKVALASLRRVLFAAPVVAATAGSHNAALTFENQRVSFTTPKLLQKAWPRLLAANPPPAGVAPAALLAHVRKLTDRLLLDENFRKTLPAFNQAIGALAPLGQVQAVAEQGIAVGGRVAQDVRVLNNTIARAAQGIHVGLSRRRANKEDVDQATTVTIAGNTVDVALPAAAAGQDRHGIFVGNCQSLLIENNNVRLDRLAGADNFPIDGIRVWGELGDRLLITKNYVASADGNQKRSFQDGIHVNPLNAKPRQAQWVVMWNVAPSTQNTVRTANGALSVPGTNTP